MSAAPAPSPPAHADVVVVGGGVIGLAAAWRMAQRAMAVALVDPAPGRGASWAAAGMLAPVSEVHHGEEPLLALALASAARWPAFAAELVAAGGRDVGYRATGTLVVAFDDGDRAWAAELHRFQAQLGLDVEWLSGREARRREPALAPGVRAAIWVGGDHQVDNRRLVRALVHVAVASGVRLHPRRAVSVRGGTPGAEVALDDGSSITAGAVVVAAGSWSGGLAGLPEGAVPPIRPVKGQILRLSPTPEAPVLGTTVRGIVQGASLYLVPRGDGTVVVGATMEERGFDTEVRAGAVYELLRDARRVVPGVAEMALAEASAGLRPGSPDNAPVIGAVEGRGVPGLVLATGHHRQGILLTPLTAEAVAAIVAGEEAPAAVVPFGPGRFGAGRADGGGSGTGPTPPARATP
ncbi:MAG TPA: glycine oxidase ThiO [Acidimicrobiales bacterium]|nr:glycine oxidase ThiO [Acidimicrobiales bacterium]